MPGVILKGHAMSQRDAQMVGQHHIALPRGWVILGLGAAAWFAVIGATTVAGAAFQAILSTIA